jgi:hypothetical protein
MGTPLAVNFSGSSVSGTVTFTENGVFLGSTWVASGQASIIFEDFSNLIDSKNPTRRSSSAETGRSWSKSAMRRGSKEPELAIPEADLHAWQK